MSKKKFVFIFVSVILLLSLTLLNGKSFTSPYVLPELDQAKSDTEVKIEDEKQSAVPPAVGMIKEIEVIGGTQRNLYVGMGKKTKGIKKGLKGYIFNDAQMKEKVGKAEIVEIYNDITLFKILEANYKVDPKGVVAVEVDPRNYIE
jgi:hypothetical protein